MRHFLANLLKGLTTVFAWTPASILIIMPFVGIYTGFEYFTEMSMIRLFGLFVIAVLAVAGYVGLTSICWGLKLQIKTKVFCLCCGVTALISVIIVGYMSLNPALHVNLSIEAIYLFICPLFFLLLHTLLELRKLLAQKA